jgi:hypothetical protein
MYNLDVISLDSDCKFKHFFNVNSLFLFFCNFSDYLKWNIENWLLLIIDIGLIDCGL